MTKHIFSFIGGMIFALAVFALYGTATAHPGRTASDGMHYCRTNCESWGVPYGQRHGHGTVKGTTTTKQSTASFAWTTDSKKAAVQILYRGLLNRDPENEKVLNSQAATINADTASIRAFTERLLGSAEFRQKNAGIFK